jgi:GNAT superfamily N-acetyltransferase
VDGGGADFIVAFAFAQLRQVPCRDDTGLAHVSSLLHGADRLSIGRMMPDSLPDLPVFRDVMVRRIKRTEIPNAAHLFRLALDASLEPLKTGPAADGELVISDWLRREPLGVFVAEGGGQLLGLALVLHWGSIGFLGPLLVHPSHWRRGIGRRLLERCLQLFDYWHCTDVELATYPGSAEHLAFYEKAGFKPGGLTVLQSWDTGVAGPPLHSTTLLSSLKTERRARAVMEIRQLMDAIHPGLILDREVHWRYPPLADTLLLRCGERLEGFAICDLPVPASGVAATCHLKFVAVRPGNDAPSFFDHLLNACQIFAASHGCTRLAAEVNETRRGIWERLQSIACRRESETLRMTWKTSSDTQWNEGWVLTDWP